MVRCFLEPAECWLHLLWLRHYDRIPYQLLGLALCSRRQRRRPPLRADLSEQRKIRLVPTAREIADEPKRCSHARQSGARQTGCRPYSRAAEERDIERRKRDHHLNSQRLAG